MVGKHLSRLMRVTFRRSGINQKSAEPTASPIAAIARNGRKCTSHMRPKTSRLSRIRSLRRLVAVIAPEVLPAALAHQLFQRAIETARGALTRQRRRQRPDLDAVAAAARQPAPEGEETDHAFALREL